VCCLLDKGAEAELTVSNRPASYAQVLTRAQQLDAEQIWGIENSGRFGRGVAQYLVRQNEQAKVGGQNDIHRRDRCARTIRIPLGM